jgi:hypothetical protein
MHFMLERCNALSAAPYRWLPVAVCCSEVLWLMTTHGVSGVRGAFRAISPHFPPYREGGGWSGGVGLNK